MTDHPDKPDEPLREDVIEKMVAWKLAGKGPEHDPDREMYQLIDSATWPELQEAVRRFMKRRVQ